MRVLGFSFASQQVRASFVDGSKMAPVLLEKSKSEYSSSFSPTEQSVWFKRNFLETIKRLQPERVAYRLSWSYQKQAQSYSLVYPCAILEIVCDDLSLDCRGFGYQQLTAKSLDFPKGADLYDHCTGLIGKHPPYWDNNQINAVLAAIACM